MSQTVHFFVYDGFADWEAAFALAGLASPAFQREPGRFQVRTVALAQTPMRSMGGLAVLPDALLDTVTPQGSAMLIIPGGPGWDDGQHMQAIDKAREFLDAGVPVAAICGATAGLARAGLLDGRRHTSNALAFLQGVPGYAGSDRYEDLPAFTDGPLITAAGAAPLEFAREIFHRLEVYEPEVLQAWYGLYKTGESKHFAQMRDRAQAGTQTRA